jgi:uncharacterized protein (DUF1697 family)
MRYIAFLRAINIGGHVVTMAELRRIFESMGFKSVETFIASGNVIFEVPKQNVKALEKRIGAALKQNLGYDVSTFVRTEEEVADIASHELFTPELMQGTTVVNVAFTSSALNDAGIGKLEEFNNELSDFVARGKEIYWRCNVRQSESGFQTGKFEKALGITATWRNMNTVRRLAARYPVNKGKGKGEK